MTNILLWTGVALIIIGGIRLVIDAFRTHFLWGIAVFLLSPFTGLIYAVLHWAEARTSVKIQLLGVALLLIAAFLEGSFKQPFEWQKEYTPVIKWSDREAVEYQRPTSTR